MEWPSCKPYGTFGLVILEELWLWWKLGRGFERDKTRGKVLDEDNVVVEVILDSTVSNLSGRGMCIGQSTIDARLTPKSQCDTCLSPTSSGKKRQGLNMLTCLDKEANGEFGHKGVRVNVAKLLYAVHKFASTKILRHLLATASEKLSTPFWSIPLLSCIENQTHKPHDGSNGD